jgi:hypothetical protein
MKNYKESVDNKSAQMDSEESLFEVEKIIEKVIKSFILEGNPRRRTVLD